MPEDEESRIAVKSLTSTATNPAEQEDECNKDYFSQAVVAQHITSTKQQQAEYTQKSNKAKDASNPIMAARYDSLAKKFSELSIKWQNSLNEFEKGNIERGTQLAVIASKLEQNVLKETKKREPLP